MATDLTDLLLLGGVALVGGYALTHKGQLPVVNKTLAQLLGEHTQPAASRGQAAAVAPAPPAPAPAPAAGVSRPGGGGPVSVPGVCPECRTSDKSWPGCDGPNWYWDGVHYMSDVTICAQLKAAGGACNRGEAVFGAGHNGNHWDLLAMAKDYQTASGRTVSMPCGTSS